MSIDMDECKKHTHNTNQLYSFPAPKKLGVLFSLHQCVRAQCGFRFPGASSLIRSLRSVMRLWRARPPQSCGKPHHCWAERRKPRESPLLKKTPKRRCYLIRLFSAFPIPNSSSGNLQHRRDSFLRISIYALFRPPKGRCVARNTLT